MNTLTAAAKVISDVPGLGDCGRQIIEFDMKKNVMQVKAIC